MYIYSLKSNFAKILLNLCIALPQTSLLQQPFFGETRNTETSVAFSADKNYNKTCNSFYKNLLFLKVIKCW